MVLKAPAVADSCAAPRLRQLFDALEGAALRLCVLAYVVGKEMQKNLVYVAKG